MEQFSALLIELIHITWPRGSYRSEQIHWLFNPGEHEHLDWQEWRSQPQEYSLQHWPTELARDIFDMFTNNPRFKTILNQLLDTIVILLIHIRDLNVPDTSGDFFNMVFKFLSLLDHPEKHQLSFLISS